MLVCAFLILISTSILDFYSTCFGQSPWQSKAEMPTGRWDLSTCTLNGKIFAIGGMGPGIQALPTVEEYDPSIDSWALKSDMPTSRHGLSTSVVSGKVYAIGGCILDSVTFTPATMQSVVEVYDPSTDTWTSKSDMPVARGFHSACVVKDLIYIIGGSIFYPFKPELTLLAYDPAKDTWTERGEIPVGIYTGSFAGVVNEKIYILGGDGRDKRVDEYNPETNTWIRMKDMPIFTTDQATCVLDGKIYVLGGEDGPPPKYPGKNSVYCYDPGSDSWIKVTEMPTGRFGLRASSINGKIYTIGGMTFWGATASRTVEEYDPSK
jgi:N-acetylneuraminic acid mutarotase